MIVSYDISALSGDEHEELNEKRLQAINTLRKIAKRYVTEEDDTYRGGKPCSRKATSTFARPASAGRPR